MKVARFYSEGELSAIRVTNVEETIFEVKNLFAGEQLIEEQIVALIRQNNLNEHSEVDELRLDFNRIYSKKAIASKTRFGRYKFSDSCFYKGSFSVQTILDIKNEQRYLSAKFKGYVVLNKRFGKEKRTEPYLFASLKNGYFYLLNAEEISSSNVIVNSSKKVFSWIQKKIFFKTSSK